MASLGELQLWVLGAGSQEHRTNDNRSVEIQAPGGLRVKISLPSNVCLFLLFPKDPGRMRSTPGGATSKYCFVSGLKT